MTAVLHLSTHALGHANLHMMVLIAASDTKRCAEAILGNVTVCIHLADVVCSVVPCWLDGQADAVERKGFTGLWRFCFQCGKFQRLEFFTGNHRCAGGMQPLATSVHHA